MKKRILSLVLSIVLLLALCPAVLAAEGDYAAFYLTEYQIQAGDTLTSICDTRGIKYEEYAAIIKNINGITNPNALVAGKKYWIPTKTLGSAERYYTVYRHVLVAGDTFSALCTEYGTTVNTINAMLLNINGLSSLTGLTAGVSVYLPIPSAAIATASASDPIPAVPTATPTPAASATAAPAATTVKAQTGDYVAFYITPYLCQTGDTLINICKARGVTYANYKALILSMNKLASETSLISGLTYWMPSSTVGSATTYYTVYRHLLVPGDTMYALCNAYGINMAKNTDLILKLNNAKNLTSFQAGKNVLIPVYREGAAAVGGTAAVPGTGINLDVSTAGVGGGTVSTTTGTDAAGNPITTTTTTSITVQELPGLFDANASAGYYLVPYTVSAGESMISICNDMGTSFSKNKDIIVKANGLRSYTLNPGTTIYLPVSSLGSATKYYSVSVKTIKWGDTVYGYYAAANADFTVNYKMLTDLNGSINFNNLPVNGKIAIPILVG